MMQAAQTRTTDHGRISAGLLLNEAGVRRVLFQGIVNAVLMVVAYVIADQPAEMLFVQRDDLVEHLAATTSDPSLGGSVGQGRQLHRMVTLLIPTSR